ncbi:hypothetical protein KJ966_22400 [bacterium]|nr:hypothetical protein [bacterium]
MRIDPDKRFVKILKPSPFAVTVFFTMTLVGRAEPLEYITKQFDFQGDDGSVFNGEYLRESFLGSCVFFRDNSTL